MEKSDQIWIIDDDRSIRWVLEKALGKAGMDVSSFPDGSRILEKLEVSTPKVIISDIRMRIYTASANAPRANLMQLGMLLGWKSDAQI